jgi:hypothetical protein
VSAPLVPNDRRQPIRSATVHRLGERAMTFLD